MKTFQIMKIENEPLSDKELLSDVINGRFESFDVIVDRYKNRLLNFVFRFVKDYDVAEDIVQETFLRVFRKRRDYKAIANFSTWIFTAVLRNWNPLPKAA